MSLDFFFFFWSRVVRIATLPFLSKENESKCPFGAFEISALGFG